MREKESDTFEAIFGPISTNDTYYTEALWTSSLGLLSSVAVLVIQGTYKIDWRSLHSITIQL